MLFGVSTDTCFSTGVGHVRGDDSHNKKSRQGGFNWGVTIFMSTAHQLSLTDQQVALISRALADRRRYQILLQISASTEAVPCAELLKVHPVSAATVSHHTKELERAGLISTVREGKYASFVMQREVLQAYAQQLMQLG
jgi:ArsR family transcriptional regulator